jgi:hypothetical protein
MVSALDVAQQGKDEWEIGASTGDPVAVGELVHALDEVQGNDVAAERTTRALPYLVAWLKRDPEFPRAAFCPVYASLLTLFALDNARGASTYESSGILIGAMLSSGIDLEAYRDLIADIDEIAGDGFGVSVVYWVLEQLSSSVTVDVSADHVGNARLRAMAENGDLFVVAWLSAKHAATDFIREHRRDRPLVYAQGRGFTSIIRAIEDYLGSSNLRGASTT